MAFHFSRVCLLSIFLGGVFLQNTGAEEIRPFKSVFQPTITQVKTSDGYLSTVRIAIPEEYYLYTEKTALDLPASAVATVTKSAAEEKNDPYFGKVRIYDHEHPAVFTIRQPNAQDRYLLKAQGCYENVICYPPEEWLLSVKAGGPVEDRTAGSEADGEATGEIFRARGQDFLHARIAPLVEASEQGATGQASVITQTATAAAAVAAVATNDDAATVAARLDRNYWLSLPWLVLLGVGVSFTACVYPLLPIVTSLVVGRHASRYRSYALIATYVLAMAAAMALLGAVFGYFRLNLQVVLQTPSVAVIVALFFALLSLSLFDVFSLRAPTFLQGAIDRVAQRQSTGSFLGATVMGAVSVLVVSPCATPVLTALLLYTTQTTPLKGAIALFCFGLGSGLPLFVFASVLRRFMPRAGNWMIVIKRLFAFLLLAVALWLLARLLPPSGAWLLWTLYALAIVLFVAKKTARSRRGFFTRALCGALLIAAITFTLQASWISLPGQGVTPDSQRRLPFQAIDDVQALDHLLAASKQTVIVEFTADWCVTCRVWEKEIWHNPRFAADLQNYHLVKVDVTDFTPAHRELFRELRLVGPPAVLFYRAGGDLRSPAKKVIGTVSADAFAALLHSNSSGS